MSSLDQEVIQWRRAMIAGGVADPAVLDELEGHLRDQVEQLVQSGCDFEQSFKTAVERIGDAGELRREFLRANRFLSFEALVSLLDDRRRCFWGAVIVAGLASVSYYWSKMRVEPIYEGVATVQLLQRPFKTLDSAQQSVATNDVQSAERLNMVLRRFTSTTLRDEVASSLTIADQNTIRRWSVARHVSNKPEPPLGERLGTTFAIPQRLSLLVRVSVLHGDAEAAALLANRYVEQCRLDLANSRDSQKMAIRVIEPASTPKQPIIPDSPRIRIASLAVAITTFLTLIGVAATLRKLAHMRLNVGLRVRTS